MISSEKEYPGDRRARIFWLALMVVTFGIAYFQVEILVTMDKGPYFNPGLNFMFGSFFMLSLYSFVNSLFRAKMRICDHFVMHNFDQNIMSWSKIKNVVVEGDSLTLYMPEARVWKTYSISLPSVPDKGEFMNEIKRICEARGIPFKEQQ